MQFLILAYDATDDDAINRRMAHREAHLATIARYKEAGHMHMGAAILDDAGKMIGSCVIAEFDSRAALDAWLAEDPYAVGKVWGDIKISLCKVAPPYLQK